MPLVEQSNDKWQHFCFSGAAYFLNGVSSVTLIYQFESRSGRWWGQIQIVASEAENPANIPHQLLLQRTNRKYFIVRRGKHHVGTRRSKVRSTEEIKREWRQQKVTLKGLSKDCCHDNKPSSFSYTQIYCLTFCPGGFNIFSVSSNCIYHSFQRWFKNSLRFPAYLATMWLQKTQEREINLVTKHVN